MMYVAPERIRHKYIMVKSEQFKLSREISSFLTSAKLMEKYIQETTYGTKKFSTNTIDSFVSEIETSIQNIKGMTNA